MAHQSNLKTAHYGKLLHRKAVLNANSNTTDGGKDLKGNFQDQVSKSRA